MSQNGDESLSSAFAPPRSPSPSDDPASAQGISEKLRRLAADFADFSLAPGENPAGVSQHTDKVMGTTAGLMNVEDTGPDFKDIGSNGLSTRPEGAPLNLERKDVRIRDLMNGDHQIGDLNGETINNAMEGATVEKDRLVIFHTGTDEGVADQEIQMYEERSAESTYQEPSKPLNYSDVPTDSGATASGREMQSKLSESNEPFKHHSSTHPTTGVDLLSNVAIGDEEGRSRQRILAFAAKRYATAVERNPEDYDALYNWALVLQESADSLSADASTPGKDQLLEEACKKYQEATRLCPTLHEAFYNWAIAISDRAKMRGRTKEAEELWKQACRNYERAVQLNWNSPQALNNWGLALQELSGIVPIRDKRLIVRTAIKKFRAAIRLQFDFHRATYNLGTVLYGLAEDTFRSGHQVGAKESTASDLYSQSAIYIASAHALKPEYPVYKSALRLVRSMLPLPYVKTGYLVTAPNGNSLAPHSDWKRLWFVLDHEALYQVEKVEQKSLGQSPSKNMTSTTSEESTILVDKLSVFRIEVSEIVYLSPCSDLSLPPGGGLCIDTTKGQQYMVADTWEAVDGWVDAIRLAYTIFVRGQSRVLGGILAG